MMNVIALFDIVVASLIDIKRYRSIILICISPTTSEEQHLLLSVGSVLLKLLLISYFPNSCAFIIFFDRGLADWSIQIVSGFHRHSVSEHC